MVPIAMPRAIAIRMYCVNLLDIFLTPVSSGNLKSGRFGGGRNKLAAFCTLARMFRLWKPPAPTSVQCSAQCVQFAASSAVNCITNETRRGENTMNATVNRQILLVEKPSGKLGPEHFKMSNAA